MKRYCALLLVLCLLCAALAATAQAEETTLDVTYVTITGDGFVAETMDGVEARYNLNGQTLLCSELVERYYREVYGLTVIPAGAPTVSGSSEYWFEVTTTPKKGDILYATEASRGGCAHYALCRSFDPAANTVTLFEQNWIWGGKAGIGRVIPMDGCYTAYTLTGINGAPEAAAPVEAPLSPMPDTDAALAAAEPFSSNGAPSDWAQIYVLRAEAGGLLTRRSGEYQKPIPRREFARLLVTAAEQFLSIACQSSDPCQAAGELGLMVGDDRGDFHADDPLTREEAAVVMQRLLALTENAPAPQLSALDVYPDRAKIASWAQESVSVATQTGLMGGTATGFSPQLTLTLEEAVTLLMRAYDVMQIV